MPYQERARTMMLEIHSWKLIAEGGELERPRFPTSYQRSSSTRRARTRTRTIKRPKQHDQRRGRSRRLSGHSLDRIGVLEMRGLARRYIEWLRRWMRGWRPNYRSMQKRPRISCSSEIGPRLSHDQGSWSENEHD